MSRGIALVADVGESFGNYSFGNDAALLDLLSTTNIACGFHAGDPRTMDATVAGALARGIELGAHPGYPDRVGFGRRRIEMTQDEISTDVLYQLGALSAFARVHGGAISHVAPHGRMGSLCRTDPTIASGVAEAVAAYDPELLVVVEPGELERECVRLGLRVARIFLADRGYAADGHPVWRDHPDALLFDPAEVGRRVVQLVQEGTLRAVTGEVVPLGFTADVVLVHGDHPQAVENARAVREAVAAASIPVQGIREVLSARFPA